MLLLHIHQKNILSENTTTDNVKDVKETQYESTSTVEDHHSDETERRFFTKFELPDFSGINIEAFPPE